MISDQENVTKVSKKRFVPIPIDNWGSGHIDQ